MARTAITDNIWEQLQTTMKAHGCHQWKNDRTVMEAILWKLRTGAPWRDIPIELGSWKTAYRGQHRIRTIMYAKEFCRVLYHYKLA